MPVVRRYSGGADVHGACGMLAGRGRERGNFVGKEGWTSRRRCVY